MRERIVLSFVMLCLATAAWAKSTLTVMDDGNVGISTAVPMAALEIENSGLNALLINGSTFVVTGGNVGVGTASPAYPLQVTGQLGFTSGSSGIILDNVTSGVASSKNINGAGNTFGTDASMSFNVPTGQGYEIDQNGAQEVVIDPSGNLGVGATAPAYRLTVAGSMGFASGASGIILDNVTSGVAASKNINGAGGIFGSNKSMGFNVPSSDGFEFDEAGTAKVVIDPSGNLGVGTAAPAQALEVNGSVQLDNQTTGAILCVTSSHVLGHCTSSASCTGTCTCTCTAN